MNTTSTFEVGGLPSCPRRNRNRKSIGVGWITGDVTIFAGSLFDVQFDIVLNLDNSSAIAVGWKYKRLRMVQRPYWGIFFTTEAFALKDDTMPQTVLFPDLFEKPLVARFDQAHANSDGGAVLLKAADQRLGVTAEAVLVSGLQGSTEEAFSDPAPMNAATAAVFQKRTVTSNQSPVQILTAKK